MPLDDIAGEALGGVFRFIARMVFEIVVEIVLRGTGAMILRVLRPKHDPGETAAALTGLAFWAAVIALGVWAWTRASVA